MTTIALSCHPADRTAGDVLVVAVAPGASPGDAPTLLGADRLPAPLVDGLSAVLVPLGVTGKPDTTLRVPAAHLGPWPVVLLTGTGPVSGAPTPEQLRRAAGAATREAAKVGQVVIVMPAGSTSDVSAIAEGALLGAYSFARYRADADAPVASVVVVADSSALEASDPDGDALLARVRVVAEAVGATRDLVNTSPLDLYPATFAQAAADAVEGLPVAVEILDEAALADGGFGGLVAVGQGSARPPRLVHLDYAPAEARSHIALVGKGITFDSGGLSIKPAAGMEAMKSDMSGAAAVLGVVVAAARLGLPVRVSGWLALAENMPSGTAQRPSDVITIRGGRTVEVLNTDAEGRLVLADALVAAGETNPDAIIDVATLTGAQMVALGNRVSAVMANDDEWRAEVLGAAEDAGEQFWPMPLPEELRASLDSPVADLANIGDRFGGMLVAGLFLQEFVADRPGVDGAKVPWAHLDIAGPAINSATPHGYTPKGGTGVAVRTMLRLVERLADR